MNNKFKYSVIPASLGKLSDRFVSDGYNEEVSLEKKFKELSKIDSLRGLELVYDKNNKTKVKKMIEKYGFEVSSVLPAVSHDKKWKFGSFSSKDKKIREEAIDLTKRSMDFAEEVGCDVVNIWPGEDGFDYSFQVDYTKQIDYFVEALNECGNYNSNIKIALEPKPKEPRNHSLIDTVGTTLLIAEETGKDNVGVSIDGGHVLYVKQSMAQTVEMAARKNRLFNIHINDNYGDWDDDMIVGSVRLMEYIELFYSLRKVEYDGYISVDIFPYRLNTFRAAEESIEYMKHINGLIDLIGFDKLTNEIENGNIPDTLKMIRESIFKEV